MSEKRSFIKFLVTLLAPFVLIGVGALMVWLGLTQGFGWMTIPGGVIALCGVLWGAIIFLFHGPIDM